MTTKAFTKLFLISLAVAILAFAMPLALKPGHWDLAIKASAVLAGSWMVMVAYAFFKVKKRGLWLLLGSPLVFFWFFVLFMIVWGCAHNIKACP